MVGTWHMVILRGKKRDFLIESFYFIVILMIFEFYELKLFSKQIFFFPNHEENKSKLRKKEVKGYLYLFIFWGSFLPLDMHMCAFFFFLVEIFYVSFFLQNFEGDDMNS